MPMYKEQKDMDKVIKIYETQASGEKEKQLGPFKSQLLSKKDTIILP